MKEMLILRDLYTVSGKDEMKLIVAKHLSKLGSYNNHSIRIVITDNLRFRD